jgi:hypothetical protein
VAQHLYEEASATTSGSGPAPGSDEEVVDAEIVDGGEAS